MTIEGFLDMCPEVCKTCGEKSAVTSPNESGVQIRVCFGCGSMSMIFSGKQEAIKFAWKLYRENCLYADFHVPKEEEFPAFAAKYGVEV